MGTAPSIEISFSIAAITAALEGVLSSASPGAGAAVRGQNNGTGSVGYVPSTARSEKSAGCSVVNAFCGTLR